MNAPRLIAALLLVSSLTIRAQSNLDSNARQPGPFHEHTATFNLEPEVKVRINAPAADPSGHARPTTLIFYALPNGNTIDQTAGRRLQPGDDWHYDIQHIGAQTRFLRRLCPGENIVVIYLEAAAHTLPRSWPAWRKLHGDDPIPRLVDAVAAKFAADAPRLVLSGHSGGGSFIFGYLNAVKQIPTNVVRIAFLDSDYAYDPARGHAQELIAWLKNPARPSLCVLAYDDAAARLNGKPFVSAAGGTWGRTHAMLADLSQAFSFTSQTNGGLEKWTALDGRIELLLKENPERKIYHTVQVERNGFIEAMVSGTTNVGNGYEYFGPRAYGDFISGEPGEKKESRSLHSGSSNEN